jgi:hypothetical protein
MDIREIPDSYDEFECYNRDYERAHFRYTEANHRVGTAIVELFAAWFPRPTRPLVRRAVHALLDDPVIAGFGFPPPTRLMRFLVTSALRARAGVLRFLPPRRRPRLRTTMRQPSYPQGYVIEQLGPPNPA